MSDRKQDTPERRAIEHGEIVYDPCRSERRLHPAAPREPRRSNLLHHWLFPVALTVAAAMALALIVVGRGHV